MILIRRNLLITTELVASGTHCNFGLLMLPILYFQGYAYLFQYNGGIRFEKSSFNIYFS